MRRSLLFLAVCSALDELVTFRNLSVGGVEFNPRVDWLISVNPLLYPLFDAAIIAVAWRMDRFLTDRQVETWIIWTASGLVRLLCFTFSLFY
ncbi:hypothetical protein KKF61_07060 [Patescibacteria group bacterium]|nr:hypothetical protein [Patescibacteria group bacterium]